MRSSGGNKKKFICTSSHNCSWYIQAVQRVRSGNPTWTIAELNLRHAQECDSEPNLSSKQLAKMNVFQSSIEVNPRQPMGKTMQNLGKTSEVFIDHKKRATLCQKGKALVLQKRKEIESF